MANKTYSEKLRDPRWQKVRLQIFQRDNFTCVDCGDDKTELHVHHEKYVGEPWDCPMDKLKTICKSCHEKEHLPPPPVQYELKPIRYGVAEIDDIIIKIESCMLKIKDTDENKDEDGCMILLAELQILQKQKTEALNNYQKTLYAR